MTHWIPYAFVRIVSFFIAGILLALFCPVSVPWTVSGPVALAALILYFIVFIVHRRVAGRVKRFLNPGFVALPFVFLAGYVNLIINTESKHENHLTRISAPVELFQIRLDDFAHEKTSSWKQVGRVNQVRIGGKWFPFEGNVQLSFSKSAYAVPFNYGDWLLVRGSIDSLRSPSNPGEFDYKKFLSTKNIFHQRYIGDDEVKWIRHDPASRIMEVAISIRQIADAKLKSLVNGQREKTLASALVLGVVDGLDNEILSAYAATGAMHVLAVSGLHVGILYWLLLILLKPLKSFSWGKWIIAIISLIVLWGYTCVTGLSPSVLRAVVMFSFVIIAYPLNFRTNIYNILAASAFCLLVYDPYLILSVGFQLSYLAVLGIVYLQPLLYNIVEIENRIWDEAWKITTVSLAAQLSTFMIGLLYFHQFPNYFLVSNLFVIPLSFVILMVGLAALSLSFIPWVGMMLGVVLTWLIKALNYLVFWVESWPFSLIENIYITPGQCWLLAMIVLLLCFFLETRHVKYIAWGALPLLMISIISWLHYSNEVRRSRLTVYNVYKHAVFEISEDGSAMVFADDTTAATLRSIHFKTAPGQLIHGIQKTSTLQQYAGYRSMNGGNLCIYNGVYIVHLYSPDFTIPPDIVIDYLIVSKNAIKSMKQLSGLPLIRCMVLDSSNTPGVCSRLLENGDRKMSLKIHSVWHQGAFSVKLKG